MEQGQVITVIITATDSSVMPLCILFVRLTCYLLLSLKIYCKTGDADLERRNNLDRDFADVTGEGNIESMLSVEKGLRELASLKVSCIFKLTFFVLMRDAFISPY